MSKGSPRYTMRFPADLVDEIAETIVRRNMNSRNPPWDWTKFVIAAVKEKIAHMERSRRPRG